MRIPISTFTATRLSRWVLFGAGVAAGMVWVSRSLSKRAQHSRHREADIHRDKTLEDYFPASDAPATRDYSIPSNAR